MTDFIEALVSELIRYFITHLIIDLVLYLRAEIIAYMIADSITNEKWLRFIIPAKFIYAIFDTTLFRKHNV